LRLIRSQPAAGAPRLHFAEKYMRELAYATLREDERRALHRQVARTIEQSSPARLDEQCELLAWHWRRAGGVPGVRAAIPSRPAAEDGPEVGGWCRLACRYR
jgi:hypothetical protein